MKRYINYKSNFGLETIEEMEVKTKEDRKELKRLLSGYRSSDSSGHYYTSQRACKEWNN